MYAAESLCLDPTCQQDQVLDEKGLLQNHVATTCVTSFSIGSGEQHQLNLLEMGKFHPSENMQGFGHEHMSNIVLPCVVHPNWEEIGFNPYNNNHQQLTYYPISSLITNPSLASTSNNIFYDPTQFNNMPVNLCTTTPQSSLLKEFFHVSPHGSSSYGLGGSSGTGSLFSHGHEEEVTGGLYHDVRFHHELISGDMINSAAIKKREGKDMKHHASEKQRRVHFSDKFQALRSMIPNPSKNDRATIIGDAIGYINELKTRVNELKKEVDLKKEMRMMKRQRIVVEEDGALVVNNMMEAADEEDHMMMNKSINWQQRKSCKNSAEVDVRVMEDEVTIKLVQQKEMNKKKRMNSLVFVSKALDELHLDLQHVSGGLIGDHYTYLFNSKICEGCRVYASAIANKVIEVLEKEQGAII